MEKLEQISQEASAQISQINDLILLEQFRSTYLGKKGKLTELLKEISKIEASKRPIFGDAINKTKNFITDLINNRAKILSDEQLAKKLATEVLDVTLPGRSSGFGSLHPVTKVRYQIEDYFGQMGFQIEEGPEIENEYYNFTALNIPPHHPARDLHDTFYFPDRKLLRTHTSPVQIHALEKYGAPLRIITPGRVYRCDYDATHTPMFNQMEILMVDEHITFANLKWILYKFLRAFFNQDVEVRFRASFFPFTEPSAEVDVKWRIGSEERWLELSGCGMVHPQVLRAGGIDSKKFTGFAFGFGMDRLAMLKYGINDLRLFFENDLQFLRQFKPT
jgi:phenylalanyl-tRNA synthetase alpha chain